MKLNYEDNYKKLVRRSWGMRPWVRSLCKWRKAGEKSRKKVFNDKPRRPLPLPVARWRPIRHAGAGLAYCHCLSEKGGYRSHKC